MVPGPVVAAGGSGTVRDQARNVRFWPLVLLAFPAAEVWSGWVGIAQATGFGRVSLLGPWGEGVGASDRTHGLRDSGPVG
jgi:hypothetical protein